MGLCIYAPSTFPAKHKHADVYAYSFAHTQPPSCLPSPSSQLPREGWDTDARGCIRWLLPSLEPESDDMSAEMRQRAGERKREWQRGKAGWRDLVLIKTSKAVFFKPHIAVEPSSSCWVKVDFQVAWLFSKGFSAVGKLGCQGTFDWGLVGLLRMEEIAARAWGGARQWN